MSEEQNWRSPEGGRRLYQLVWRDVRKLFFDQARLDDWDSWRHKFDDQIVDRDSARHFIAQCLRSLDDPYTGVLPDREGPNDEDAAAGNDDVFSRLLPDGMGYVRIATFDRRDLCMQVKAELDKLKHCRGYVIDLRGNQGGLLDEAIRTAELFLHKGALGKFELREPDGLHVRNFVLRRRKCVRYDTLPDGTKDVQFYTRRPCVVGNKPVVLLIDEHTSSATEFFIDALICNGGNDGRTIAIGKTTSGKGIGQQPLTYEDGTKVMLTAVRFYGPDGRWFGDVGKTVTNGVRPAIELGDFNACMDAAMQFLKKHCLWRARLHRFALRHLKLRNRNAA